MRTIKFRGRGKSGKWHYGDLMQYDDGAICIGEHSQTWTDDGYHNSDYKAIEHVDEDTIGQFTGLLDKNGKEIYEGDIIEGDGYRHIVTYKDKDACYVAQLLYNLSFKVECNIQQSWIDEFQKVVIGNIYDNPELLKNNND